MSEESLSIMIASPGGEQVLSFQLNANETIANLKALFSAQTQTNQTQFRLTLDGNVLEENATLSASGVKTGDLLLVQAIEQQQQQQQQQPVQLDALAQSLTAMLREQRQQNAPNSNQQLQRRQQQQQQQSRGELEAWRQSILANAQAMAQLSQNRPNLAVAVREGDLDTIGRVFAEENARKRAQEAELRRLQADPMNPASQQRIEEIIRQRAIEENMGNAMEYNPAAFGRVVMLYIDCKVNGVPVKAFVDSGAQSTIMSQSIARKCNITHLIDRRWQGVAKGVGTSRILGRVHMAPLMISGSTFMCSFTILENDDMDFLLGLDMLKAHQAMIDCKQNKLIFGSVETPFLAEKDLPASAKQSAPQSNETTSSTSSTSSTITTSTSFPETAIQQLMSLGATREAAIQVLTASNGNVEQAAGLLF